MKISVTSCRVRGNRKWRVRWGEGGKAKRKFFPSRESADAHATKLRGEQLGINHAWADMTQADRERLILAWKEAARRGIDLLSLVVSADSSAPATSPGVKKVLDELVAVKTKAGKDPDYVKSLRHRIGAFCKDREAVPMARIVFSDVEKFIDSYKLPSRSTVRSRLSTWFKFGVRRGYCAANLCERVELPKRIKPPPHIFTIEQVETLLEWFKKNPRAFAWFTLSAFAGLRPEEAQQTTWGKIHFDEGWIKVEGDVSKVDSRRVVYPLPTAIALLKLACDLKSQLPLTTKQLQIERIKFRAEIGFAKWPQDITRHTAASMWLAVSEEPAKVANNLGHSEYVLHRDYKALVTREEAKKFWALERRQ